MLQLSSKSLYTDNTLQINTSYLADSDANKENNKKETIAESNNSSLALLENITSEETILIPLGCNTQQVEASSSISKYRE